jgi:hypothetical protein
MNSHSTRSRPQRFRYLRCRLQISYRIKKKFLERFRCNVYIYIMHAANVCYAHPFPSPKLLRACALSRLAVKSSGISARHTAQRQAGLAVLIIMVESGTRGRAISATLGSQFSSAVLKLGLPESPSGAYNHVVAINNDDQRLENRCRVFLLLQ